MAISSIQFLHSLRPFNASFTTTPTTASSSKNTKTPRVSLGFRSSVNFNLCSLSSGFFVSSSAPSRSWALARDKGERTEDYPPVTDSVDDDQVTLSFSLFQYLYNESYTFELPILDSLCFVV